MTTLNAKCYWSTARTHRSAPHPPPASPHHRTVGLIDAADVLTRAAARPLNRTTVTSQESSTTNRQSLYRWSTEYRMTHMLLHFADVCAQNWMRLLRVGTSAMEENSSDPPPTGATYFFADDMLHESCVDCSCCPKPHPTLLTTVEQQGKTAPPHLTKNPVQWRLVSNGG